MPAGFRFMALAVTVFQGFAFLRGGMTAWAAEHSEEKTVMIDATYTSRPTEQRPA